MQASLQVMPAEEAQLWWAAKEMQRGKKLQDYVGKNEKTKICGSTVEKGGVAGAEFSQWFCSLINVCSSLQSLLCLFERNIALQPKIQGNLGDLYEQNDVSVSKVQFRFK